MQIPSTDPVVQVAVPTGAGVTARVVSGNLATIPLGALLEATVTTVSPREAVLTVAGQQLTVRPPFALPPGGVVLVRVPPNAANSANPTVELALPAATAAVPRPPLEGEKADVAKPTAPTVPFPARAAVVDVLSELPGGRVQVSIEGQEQTAIPTQPLAPGGRYVLQVERTPNGIVLKPPPETPALPTQVATAVLRAPAPTLGEAIKPLQAELTSLTTPQPQSQLQSQLRTSDLKPLEPQQPQQPPLPPAARAAAIAVRDVLSTMLPNEPRPLKAPELQQLVENGGLHYEAKLARLVEPQETAQKVETGTKTEVKPEAKLDSKDATQTTKLAERAESPPAPRSVRDLGPDLKGDLLRLLQTVDDIARVPAAQAALSGIESQQAANALAQASGTPYHLQVPFPDGGEWRTMQLSLEPQSLPDQPDAERAGRFRMFMHVPLSELGETWIDAGLSGDRFRATIYLDRTAVRERVQAALPELQAELEADGFSEVLLDVRPSSELPDYRRRDSASLQAGRPRSVSVLDVKV